LGRWSSRAKGLELFWMYLVCARVPLKISVQIAYGWVAIPKSIAKMTSTRVKVQKSGLDPE
jgi:hypothetical protein